MLQKTKYCLSLFHSIHLIISNDRVFTNCFFKTSECELIRKQTIQRMYIFFSREYTEWWYKMDTNTHNEKNNEILENTFYDSFLFLSPY